MNSEIKHVKIYLKLILDSEGQTKHALNKSLMLMVKAQDMVIHVTTLLFILDIEGLSSLLKKKLRATERFMYQGVQRILILSHILFANNCFFFLQQKQKHRSSRKFLKFMEKHQDRCRSQKLYSAPIETHNHVYLRCLNNNWIWQILGPTFNDWQEQKEVFRYLNDRIWRHINHWLGEHLSKAGKEILIKSYA